VSRRFFISCAFPDADSNAKILPPFLDQDPETGSIRACKRQRFHRQCRPAACGVSLDHIVRLFRINVELRSLPLNSRSPYDPVDKAVLPDGLPSVLPPECRGQ